MGSVGRKNSLLLKELTINMCNSNKLCYVKPKVPSFTVKNNASFYISLNYKR